jgi:hypothetical protein
MHSGPVNDWLFVVSSKMDVTGLVTWATDPDGGAVVSSSSTVR